MIFDHQRHVTTLLRFAIRRTPVRRRGGREDAILGGLLVLAALSFTSAAAQQDTPKECDLIETEGWRIRFEDDYFSRSLPILDKRSGRAVRGKFIGGELSAQPRFGVTYRPDDKRYEAKLDVVVIAKVKPPEIMPPRKIPATVTIRKGSDPLATLTTQLNANTYDYERPTIGGSATTILYSGDIGELLKPGSLGLAGSDTTEIAIPEILDQPIALPIDWSGIDTVKREMASPYDVATREANGKCAIAGKRKSLPGAGGGGGFWGKYF
jgi:hypothetical protein